eukprot:GHVL01032869.1.p1 GENE.GHVL01032869.1~~GHVL01032869.1.p1  ORF type:complete len:170 (-),score=33.37 GHVL01032869.1:778-1287(-)
MYKGAEAHAWADIDDLKENSHHDYKGYDRSCKIINKIIQEEKIPSTNIIVGGFSQGGSIALDYSLTSNTTVGGCIGLSTYLAFDEDYPQRYGSWFEEGSILRIFLGHGRADQIVPPETADSAKDTLRDLPGIICKLKLYDDIDHQICNEELADVIAFIAKCFNYTVNAY